MTINPNNKLNDNPNGIIELLQSLKQLGRKVQIEKGKTILTEGDEVDFVFFVEKGCFRCYRWINDEEVTIGFSFEGDIDTCPYAFINKTESTDIIEALTNCNVIKIYRGEIDELKKYQPELDGFIQGLLSHYIEVLIQRNIDLRTKNADQLYRKLYKRQPKEVAQIPLMYIASYLGISKERLSRIRKNFIPID
ncbi:MAG: Crp/Fnr family transcriptional regulator [Bacteroidia bacterium]|nr:Crp/Fnr family transcriptional regulator [Bacteroidia bacterium]